MLISKDIEVYLEIIGSSIGFIKITDTKFLDTLFDLEDGSGLRLHFEN